MSDTVGRMLLREMHLDELSRVLELEADPDAAPFILRWSDGDHRRSLSDPDEAHLTLEQDGQMVGFVLLAGLRSPDHNIELRRIVVSPPGCGLGAVALELVIARAFEQLHAHRLWLDVKTNNDRAQRAYRRAGFVQEGVLRDARLTDGIYESLIVMSILEAERSKVRPSRRLT